MWVCVWAMKILSATVNTIAFMMIFKQKKIFENGLLICVLRKTRFLLPLIPRVQESAVEYLHLLMGASMARAHSFVVRSCTARLWLQVGEEIHTIAVKAKLEHVLMSASPIGFEYYFDQLTKTAIGYLSSDSADGWTQAGTWVTFNDQNSIDATVKYISKCTPLTAGWKGSG